MKTEEETGEMLPRGEDCQQPLGAAGRGKKQILLYSLWREYGPGKP